jgi:hypothetical protein
MGERMIVEIGADPASLAREAEKQAHLDKARGKEDMIRQLRERAATFDAANKDYIIDLNDLRLVEVEEE